MKLESRQQLINDLPAHIEAAVARDKADFPAFYAGGFRSNSIIPRPLVGVFISALSYGPKRHDEEALYRDLDASLRQHTVANGTASVAVATMRRDDKGTSRISTKLCADAEPYLSRAYSQILGSPPDASAHHRKLSVYHDQHGEPVMVRKNLEVHTAITIQDILDQRTGITLPSGTIVGMSRVRDESVTGDTVHSINGQSTRLRAVEFDPQLEPVLPLRLSAWAFSEPISQAAYAATGSSGAYDINEQRLDIILSRSLDDFRALGNEILDICGVR